MIIFRYFTKEVLSTLSALTIVILLIFLSNQFVRYLQLAASGQMPGMFVLKLMMLEIPNLLGLLLPLGLFMGVLLAYGRLYADSEMTVLTACGLSRWQLFQMTMALACFVAVIVSILSLWLGPEIIADRQRLLSEGRSASIVQLIMPQRFQSAAGGKQVFYVESMSRDREHAENVFVAQQSDEKIKGIKPWDVISAETATSYENEETGESFVVMHHGYQYTGSPGEKNFRVLKFEEYGIRLPESKPTLRKKERFMPTSELWPINNKNPLYAAELQWRLSIPLMTLVLGFLAIPMSRVNPRQGKFAKVLPAVLVYIVYANMMFVTRRWIATGQLSSEIGMWWLHIAVVFLGIILLFSSTWKARMKKLWVSKL